MRRWMLVALAVGLVAPAALGVNFANVDLELASPAYVAPGTWVLAQKIDADDGATVTKVHVFNKAVGTRLAGADVERIEVRRASDGKVLKAVTTAAELADLAKAGGVEIATSQYNAFTAPFQLEIWVKLKLAARLARELKLDSTTVTYNPTENVDYTGQPAATLTVGPSPGIAFDGFVPGAEVYPGQRFLAGRIAVDATDVPFELTIAQLVLENDAGGTQLAGAYIEGIEVRRAGDGALLGQATAAEIAKLTTTGTLTTTSSNNEVPGYSQVGLEIWVTLKTDAPIGQSLRLIADVGCGGIDLPAGGGRPVFTVGEPAGFEGVTNLDLTGGRVFSQQRFLAQRIDLVDDDLDPYDVTVNSLVVQNVADAATRLAENQIASIEAIRARDGAPMGQVTNASGLNAGGVRISTATENIVPDDTVEIIELWVTLADNVPHDRVVRLQTVVWHTEDTKTFGYMHDGPDSAEYVTGPATGGGFERSNPATLDDRVVFQGVRFLALQLKLEDDDLDPDDVTVTSLMIRNVAGDNRLADQYVTRLEVRRKSDGALLGQVADPVGLSLAGTRVTASANNAVLDDAMVQLEIWVTLKAIIPVGRKAQLESEVWHTEGAATYVTAPLVGPATFTTDLGDPPTGVDFSWAPADPSFEDEISFVSAGGISDPEGDISKATFRWSFGDGETKQTVGSATVKHTYGDGGAFSVTLKVTGEDGLASSKTKTIEVEGPPNEPPTIDELTADPENPAVDQDVQFGATVADPDQPEGTALGYAWDFGDETTSTVANPTHRFDAAETYTVTLTVTDARGATDAATIEIVVGNEPPAIGALIATPTSPTTGEEVELRATNVTDPDGDAIDHYEWDFGDGTTLNPGGRTVAHVFTTSDTYTVSVVAVDARGARSAAKIVNVVVTGPARTVLFAFPNPAATAVTFTYFLPGGATDPILRIYNLIGELILEEELPAGGTTFEWDLRMAEGTAQLNGLYFCVVTVTGANPSEIFRLLIVR